MLRLLVSQLAQIDTSDVHLPNKVQDSAGFFTQNFQSILQVVFGTFGAIAALIITIAAFQYVLSSGDSAKISKSKDTIIYALIGLVVAILAYSIVSFVLDGIFK